MIDLFHRPTVQLEKVAAEAPLPEDPNTWPSEILQELFKQVPYISAFTPNVVMQRVDAERGYAMGFVEVTSKTELKPGTSPEALQAAGVQRVRIPIIVRDRKLLPFDLVLTEKSKMLPLTEERLSQAIFRPQPFDVVSSSPGDQSILTNLYPPYRNSSGFAGAGGQMSSGMGKLSSSSRGTVNLQVIEDLRATYRDAPLNERANFEKWAALSMAALAQAADKAKKIVPGAVPKNIVGKGMAGGLPSAAGAAGALKTMKLASRRPRGSLLAVILPTINEGDFNKFASVVSDPEVRAQMTENSLSCRPALQTLAGFQGGAFQKAAGAMAHAIKPDVVQVVAREDGYHVKTAHSSVWQPHTYVIDRGQLVRDFGTKIALAADQNGAVTAVEGGATPEETPGASSGLITKPGVYQVTTLEGAPLEGWVIPGLLDLDGTAMPICLFTNGQQMAVQGEIAGVPASSEVPLAEGPPQGHGCFVRHGEAGLEATIPMEIKATISDGGDVIFATKTYDGHQVDVTVQPQIQQITLAPSGHVLIPESFQWLPLQGDAVVLVGAPGEERKMASARHVFDTVLVRAGGVNTFSISGPLLEKVAYEEREFIDSDQAMFLLGGLGVDPQYAVIKLAQAVAQHRPIEVQCSRAIKTATERREEAKTAALKTLDKLPVLRRELFKEAAAIPDPVAVDTILSLGFINPENLAHFVTFLPVLDEAQTKMCELLLGARLGVRDLQIGSLEKAIHSLEEVIKGLKIMAFAQN